MESENYYLETKALTALGYRDYIAARLLFNNVFYQQAIVSASSAVEKYPFAAVGVP